MSFRLQVPDVQDALAAAIADWIADLVTPDPVPCDVGYPDDLLAEHIWVDVDFDAALPRYVSGGALRDEDSVVHVRILLTMEEGPATTLRDRALVIAGYVEDAVEADRTLGGLVDFVRVIHAQGQYGRPDGMRQYGVTLDVRYELSATASGG